MGDRFWSHWGRFLDSLSSGGRPLGIARNHTAPDAPPVPSCKTVDLPAGDRSGAASAASDTAADPEAAGSGPVAIVRSTFFDAPAVAVGTVPMPKVVTYRVRIARPHVTTSTIRFPELVEESFSAHSQRSANRSGTRRSRPRPKPPAGLPMRERLISLLQPPLATLLGDERLWLPFEPFPYQYDGIQFLAGRWSALLADEMGLGKTMQAIMALRVLLRSGQASSALLVCPKPLASNWMREFRMWAEEIPVTKIEGDVWTRRNLWLHDRRPVKIINYESLTRDEEVLREGRVSFDVVVLDEAQRIKNADSKTSQAVHSLRRKRSWALTGTPVENHPTDLVSLLTFVHNGRAPAADRPDLLRDEVGDVLLRRTKEMVMDDLPPKLVNDVLVDLGPNQQQRYDAIEKEGVYQLNDLGDEISIEHVFELVRRLKQICNFDPVTGESTKADQLGANLEEIAESGQKAIVFSQWVTTLEELARRLADYQPLLYHGQIPQRRRDQILTEFRQEARRSVLLLSYGAGAVGLNLQFSNYVFLFDRWWNPAVEDQAINRAHRVGQKSPVFVSRFLVPGTIEERIAEVLENKRELFSFLIDDHDPLAAGGLNQQDVFGLFDLKVRRRTT